MMGRTIAVMGHYGSGKTEFCVNLAMKMKEDVSDLALIDLDIANPYFRSRERQKQLEAAGVPAGLIRMSCGLENAQDLIADIAQALDRIG